MDAVVKAASYTKPTTVKVSVKTAANVVTKTTEVNVTANFAHTVYVAEVLDKSSNVTTAAGTEVFAYKDGDSFYVVQKVGEVVTGFSSTTDFGVVAAISAKIDGSNGLGSAAYMAKYIRNFADGETGLVTGATVKAGAYMKAEAYTITSAGNIVLDITPNYGYDEHMIYTYTDNKVASVFNKTTTTSEWGASVTATLQTVTPATFDATAAAALLKLC